jgi:ribosomal protein S27E
VEETMKNGRKAIKGKCPTCGTVMFKILGGKAAAAPSPAEPAAQTPVKPASTK